MLDLLDYASENNNSDSRANRNRYDVSSARWKGAATKYESHAWTIRSRVLKYQQVSGNKYGFSGNASSTDLYEHVCNMIEPIGRDKDSNENLLPRSELIATLALGYKELDTALYKKP